MEQKTKPSHKEWRKMAKKFRRKRIRQSLAKIRDEEEQKLQVILENDPKYIVWQTEQKALELFKAQEEERIREEENNKWVENELKAQKEWVELQEKIKVARELKEKQQLLIQKEWEEQQKKIKEEQELKAKKLKEQEEKYEMFMQKIEHYITNGGEIPDELKVSKDTNPLKPPCPFFTKIGSCRFGNNCSRNHQSPGISKVLLIRNFYSHFGIEKCFNSEYGNDMILEYDDKETYEHFKEFFFDTIAEFKKSGRVVQYKVCCNTEPHLRGNVYVEYERTRDALKAYREFQGRWYGGKQLNVEFSGVASWKRAICGMLAVFLENIYGTFFKKLCHKGKACNFLHVFRNPGNMFFYADQDLHHKNNMSEIKNEFVDDLFNDESSERNWRWSESPEPTPSSSKGESNKDTDYSKRYSKSRKERDDSSSRERSSSRSSQRSSRSDKIYHKKSSKEKHRSYSERSTIRNHEHKKKRRIEISDDERKKNKKT